MLDPPVGIFPSQNHLQLLYLENRQDGQIMIVGNHMYLISLNNPNWFQVVGQVPGKESRFCCIDPSIKMFSGIKGETYILYFKYMLKAS